MKHSKLYEKVKVSKAGEILDYKIEVYKLPDGRFVAAGGFVKPNGKWIYNITVKLFNKVNEAMIGYSKLIKLNNKRFLQ